jgi:hypothetical protein
MSDASPMVRTGAELAMQLGKIKNPPPEVVAELQKLSQQKGFFDFESGTAASILENLNGAGTIADAANKPQPVTALPPGTSNPKNNQSAAMPPGGSVGAPQGAPRQGLPTASAAAPPATPGGKESAGDGMDPAQLAQMLQALGGQAGVPPDQIAQVMQSLGGPAAMNAPNIPPAKAASAATPNNQAALPASPPGTRLNTISAPQQAPYPQPVRMAGLRLNLQEGG